MYQLDYLGREHASKLRQEAEIQRLAASVRQATGKRNQLAANTLVWAGKQLSTWGDQLQKQSAELAK